MKISLDANARRQLDAYLLCSSRDPRPSPEGIIHDAIITGLCAKWARFDPVPERCIPLEEGLRIELMREDIAPVGEPVEVTWGPRDDRAPAKARAEQIAAAVGCDVIAVYEAAARIGMAKLEPTKRHQEIRAALAAKGL